MMNEARIGVGLGAVMLGLRGYLASLAYASVFLEAFGHTVLAWIWLRQALAARRGLRQGAVGDEAFYRGKLAACRWFYRWELPKTRQWHELLRSLDDTTLTMPAESF